MSDTATVKTVSRDGSAAAKTARRRRWKIGDAVIPTIAALALLYLMVPIFYTVAFSFNDAGRSNLVWRGFTWDNWLHPCAAPQICEAFTTSLTVGAVSTVLATVLGTAMAMALVRFRFRGRAAINLLVFLPMSTPEVVLGAALAAQFLSWYPIAEKIHEAVPFIDLRVTFGFWTIVIAHVLFCISFVVVTVKARIATLDPALEEAGADLYGSPFAVFWKVTFPLLLPGIAAAALLAFSLSFDDFIVTNFNAGSTKTFPMFVYISANRGVPPQANVIGSAMFIAALLIVVVVQVIAARKARKMAPGR